MAPLTKYQVNGFTQHESDGTTLLQDKKNHKTSSDTESDQLDWDPERIDDDGYPLVDENGSTPVPVPREGPLEEDEASSLTAWAQGYREVRKKLAQENCAQNYVRKETTETRSKHPHSIPRQSERSQHRTCHWSRVQKTHRCYRCRQLGHRRGSVRIQHRRISLNLQPRISFCQEMLLHSCIICRLTCCTMVHPRLLWDATLI